MKQQFTSNRFAATHDLFNLQTHTAVRDKAAQCTCRLVRKLCSRHKMSQVSLYRHTALSDMKLQASLTPKQSAMLSQVQQAYNCRKGLVHMQGQSRTC